MTTRKESPAWLWIAAMALSLLQLTHITAAQTEHEKCVAALLEGDYNGNNVLNKDPEYIVFLNELSEFQYGFLYYDDLPESLKMNFEFFQESVGVIDITAARMGEESTTKQQRLVETMCKTTVSVLMDIPLPEYEMNSTMFPTSEDTLSLPPTDSMDEIGEIQPESVPSEGGEPTTEVPNNVYSESPGSTSAPEVVSVTRPPRFGETEAPLDTTRANVTEGDGETVHSPVNETVVPALLDTTTNLPVTQAPSDARTNPPTTQAPSISPTALPTDVLPNTTDTSSVSENAAFSNVTTNATGLASELVNISSSLIQATNATAAPGYGEATAPTQNLTATPTNSSDQFSNETELLQNVNETSIENVTEDSVPTSAPDPYASCKLVMRFSDVNADGYMNKVEYVCQFRR